jgi:hypothetical protein
MSVDLIWLAWAFTATNAVRALFYVLQIVAVARRADGARDIALSTWTMWTFNNALGAAYAGIVVGDVAMALSFGASVAGCAVTIVLTLFKRRGLPRVGAARGASPSRRCTT